jgi:hypothetical protein
VSTNFLSTRPVLQCLQDIVDVPLADEVVHSRQSQPNDYLDTPALQQVCLYRTGRCMVLSSRQCAMHCHP